MRTHLPSSGKAVLPLTLKLCASLSEAEEDWDPESACMRPLLDLLRIGQRARRQAGPIESHPLFNASELLTLDAIAQASRNRMEALSAFDARAWGWLRGGWEISEHSDRHETRREREAELAELQQVHGTDTAEAGTAMARLASGWPPNPEQRKRRWSGWWPKAEA